jgi:hypothetical protein
VTSLSEVLASVRERIARYRGLGGLIGEQNTKAALIEPVLRALGWDVEDPEEVWREYKRQNVDNPVDYALMILRSPRLFVEAKGLGENLEDPRWANQIVTYAVMAGVAWVLLTNGDEYRIYNTHARVPMEEKLFRAVRLTDEDPRTEGTLDVLAKERVRENWIDVLWKAHFVDRQLRVAIDGLFGPDPDPSLVRLIARRIPTLQPAEIKAGLARVRIRPDFPEELSPAARQPMTAHRPVPAKQGRRLGAPTPSVAEPTSWKDVSIRDVVKAGLIQLPLDLEKTYLGHHIAARIEADGRITFAGDTYDSLSTAAGVARASIIGAPPGRKYPQTNGWIFWRFRDQDGKLRPLDILRQRCFESERRTGA